MPLTPPPAAMRALSPNPMGRPRTRSPSPIPEGLMDYSGMVPQPEPPPEKGLGELFVESLLDVVACTGRSCVACSRGTATVVSHAAYPVKEAVITTIDSSQQCLHPHLKKKAVNHTQVPTFKASNSPAPRSRHD
mmetsp:Transcript_42710/g.81687  ORF Transcript_42710/g.81687 Transcript_42710/m.81687 type:complete len:134 (+) Transcript_42710:66-467(+)